MKTDKALLLETPVNLNGDWLIQLVSYFKN